jgi:hypothetical protein
VRNSSVALYLGCAVLLVGGLGLTAWSMLDLSRPAESAAVSESAPAPPSYLHTATIPPPPANWSSNPEGPGVAFYVEMIELLTPRTAAVARHEAAEPTTEGRGHATVREVPSRETVREAPKESQQKSTAASRKKREQPKQVAEPQQREEIEIVVHDRFGNRVRTQRVEREAHPSGREFYRGEQQAVRREPETVREPPRTYTPGPMQMFDSLFRW